MIQYLLNIALSNENLIKKNKKYGLVGFPTRLLLLNKSTEGLFWSCWFYIAIKSISLKSFFSFSEIIQFFTFTRLYTDVFEKNITTAGRSII